MRKNTLFYVKSTQQVPTDGIYVKNDEEANKSKNSNINYHKTAEMRTINLFKKFNLKKNFESDTAIDLVGNYNDIKFYIEVERDYATKTWTSTNNFPYSQINIPIEKGRYFKEYKSKSFYLKYNRKMEEIFMVPGDYIINYSKKEDLFANHSGFRAKRTFLRIDKNYVTFANINDIEEIENLIISKIEEK